MFVCLLACFSINFFFLKEQNSSNQIEVEYLYHGESGTALSDPKKERRTKTLDAAELEHGFSFPHDEILSVHSQEPTLEDVFIRCTGRGLDG